MQVVCVPENLGISCSVMCLPHGRTLTYYPRQRPTCTRTCKTVARSSYIFVKAQDEQKHSFLGRFWKVCTNNLLCEQNNINSGQFSYTMPSKCRQFWNAQICRIICHKAPQSHSLTSIERYYHQKLFRLHRPLMSLLQMKYDMWWKTVFDTGPYFQ